MNLAHPAVVHVPLGLAVVLPVVALAVTLALWRGWLAPRAFALVVLLQALMFGAGLFALRTGHAAEERGAEAAVEAHEEAAERFMWGAGISLAIGMIGVVFGGRGRELRWIAAATTASAVAVALLAVSAGEAGGRVAHGAVTSGHVEEDDD